MEEIAILSILLEVIMVLAFITPTLIRIRGTCITLIPIIATAHIVSKQ